MNSLGGWGSSITLATAWQSSIVLGCGWLASRAVAMRPARAHRILLAAVGACLVMMPASFVAQRWDWGLLGRPVESTDAVLPTAGSVGRAAAPASGSMLINQVGLTNQSIADQVRPITVGRDQPTAEPTRLRASRAEGSLMMSEPAAHFSEAQVGFWIGCMWAGLAGVGVIRLFGAFILAWRLKAGSVCVTDTALLRDVANAARALGLNRAPEIRASGLVRCPVVWCWGWRPLLIIPDGPASSIEGRVAIFCHELAHWKRVDHLASLGAEVLTALLPWQPLAWLIRSRMADLAELACDDWALAHAQSVAPDRYAEALLGQAIGVRRPLVPAAVSSRSGLVARVRHILNGSQPLPRSGRVWCLAITTMALGLVVTLALTRTRAAQAVPTARPIQPQTPTEARQPGETMIEGTVRNAEGQPVAGAEVLWVGAVAPAVSHIALPVDNPQSGKNSTKLLVRGATDDAGRFTLTAPIRSPRRDGDYHNLLVHRDGFAPTSAVILLDGRPINVMLAPPVAIRGRLLTPAGDPASGVVVRLEAYTNGQYHQTPEALYVSFGERNGWAENFERRPQFFPEDVRTEADGRFTIAGFVPAGVFATLRLEHPDYAVDEVTVATDPKVPVPGSLRAFSVQPVPLEFTHTLGPARPVVGQVVDAETRQPIAGIAVQVIPMRRHGGMTVRTRTDAQGRYRVADKDAQTYFVTAFPAPDSGYLPAEQNALRWPEGATELRVDLALRRGLVLRGRVVDEDSGQPIPGVGVVYQPQRGNKNVRDEDEFRSPNLTDADGRFAITGLRGSGVLVAEGPSPDYIRHPVNPIDFGMDKNMQVHGLARFTVPDQGDPAEVVIKLRKGVTLAIQTTTPQGKPRSVRGWCPELTARLLNNWLQPREFADGLFLLPGAEPGRTYRVFLLSDDRKYAKVAEIRVDPNQTKPIVVPLEATGRIQGRVVDRAGAPAEGSQILLRMQLVDKGPKLTREMQFGQYDVNLVVQFTGEPLQQAYPAEFDDSGLFPGIRHFVTWTTPGNNRNLEWRMIEPLQPGETRVLGDIRSERPEGEKDEN